MSSDDAIQEAFSLFDRDGVSSVSYADVGKAVRSLGYNPTEGELKEFLHQVDGANSGVIDYSQFVALMAKVKSKPMSSDAEIRSAFEVLDKKKTGIVKVDELRHLLTKVGEALTDAEVDQLLEAVGATGETIKYDELVKVMTQR